MAIVSLIVENRGQCTNVLFVSSGQARFQRAVVSASLLMADKSAPVICGS